MAMHVHNLYSYLHTNNYIAIWSENASTKIFTQEIAALTCPRTQAHFFPGGKTENQPGLLLPHLKSLKN